MTAHEALKNNVDAFKNDVLQMSGVYKRTVSSYLPVDNSSRNDKTFFRDPSMDVKNGLDMQYWTIDL